MFNFALLGTGKIADRSLAPALAAADGTRLWSVLSRDRARAAEFAARHGAAAAAAAHDSLPALLADEELHAVLVATPDRLHASAAIAAAEAGKHVLVEKPMCTDRDDATRMIDAASAAGVTLGVAYHLRWHAGHRQAIAAANAGELGDLRHVRARWSYLASDATNWRAHTEVGRWWSLGAVGTHCLDLVRWALTPSCGEVVDLQSTISRGVWSAAHDETAVLALRFESGATAEICSSVQFDAPSALEIHGSRGSIMCSGTLGPHGDGEVCDERGAIDYTVKDPYVGELEDFVAAVREGRPPEVDGLEGRRNVDLLLRAVGDTAGAPLPLAV